MKTRRRIASLTIVVLATLAVPSPAWAHDEPVSFSPADGSVVASAPDHVAVTFEEPPGSGPVGLEIRGPDGTVVSDSSPEVNGVVLSERVHVAAAGAYLVKYSIVSDDGHPVSGSFTFDFHAGAQPTAGATARTTSKGGGPGTAWWLPSAVAVLVLGGCGVVVRTRMRLRALTSTSGR